MTAALREHGSRTYFCWRCHRWHRAGSRIYDEHLREMEGGP